MSLLSSRLLLLVIILNITLYLNVKCDGMVEVFQWKQMDFYNRGQDGVPVTSTGGGGGGYKKPFHKGAGNVVFPDQLQNIRRVRTSPPQKVITSRDYTTKIASRWSAEQPSSDNSSYIAYNNVPMGVLHYNERLFITMPRRRIGIPSTLNYVDMRKDGSNKSPKLHAYPNFETNYLDPNHQPNLNRLISVYRTSVDECKRLWFIDTGMLEYPDNRLQVQRPSIWVIDLTTDRVIKRFEIPENIVGTGQGLASITVDVDAKNCNEAFAYIPDLVNSALYVYSFATNRIWSFSHNYFNFDPVAGDLSIAGIDFRWDDGVFSATLGPPEENGYRNVYFHAMASNNEFVVNSEVLQNEANAARSDHGQDFQLLGSRGTNRQSTMHEYDPKTGVIFYNEIQRNGVGCWNTKQEFSADNHGTVAQDAERMIYPSDLTIDESGTVWIMTNSMPLFIYASLDPNTVNFRVWKQTGQEAIKNTQCQ